jgi:hypothetical protein
VEVFEPHTIDAHLLPSLSPSRLTIVQGRRNGVKVLVVVVVVHHGAPSSPRMLRQKLQRVVLVLVRLGIVDFFLAHVSAGGAPEQHHHEGGHPPLASAAAPASAPPAASSPRWTARWG